MPKALDEFVIQRTKLGQVLGEFRFEEKLEVRLNVSERGKLIIIILWYSKWNLIYKLSLFMTKKPSIRLHYEIKYMCATG